MFRALRLRQAQVWQALRAGSTRVSPAYGKDN